MEIFFKIFISIFLAELGDKTQMASIIFSSNDPSNKWIIFLASSMALVFSSFLGVMIGSWIASMGLEKYIRIVGGIIFVILGVFMIFNLEFKIT